MNPSDLCTCGKPRNASVHRTPYDLVPGRHEFKLLRFKLPAQQRRTDLCTCGKPQTDRVHDTNRPVGWHPFMPHPQPPPLPTVDFVRVHAVRLNGVWVAEVFGGRSNMGRGQAALWLDAINAAIEDLKEKQGG